MPSKPKYSFSEESAIKIKELLLELRTTPFQSRKKTIRGVLRNSHDFFISKFGSDFTCEDFDNLIMKGEITLFKSAKTTPYKPQKADTQHPSAINYEQIKSIRDQVVDGVDDSKYIKCQICLSQLELKGELLDAKILICPMCGNSFKNIVEEKRYKQKIIIRIVVVLVLMWCMGKCIQSNDAGKTKVYEQSNRTEIYYHNANGDIIKRKTIYKDGRSDEYKYYK